jgi:raffinose/stachyose/melibiose transport system substrate-binding protein
MYKARILLLVAALCLSASLVFAGGRKEGEAAKGKVAELTFTSWRTEDIERMNRVCAVFNQRHPNIKVSFQPISDQEYDAQALAALESGVGADIFFLRSYDSGKVFHDGGYLYVLNEDLPTLKSFPTAAVNAWSADGQIYGVPFVGVTHGVYYRTDLFKKYNLAVPETWAEFLNVCKVLKQNGEIVFAQGSMEGWPLYEVIYSGLGANFYGGEPSRQALMAGKMKLTDPAFVKAFTMIDQLQPYFPAGYESLDYVSMQQMFGTGQAAMFIGGSWEIGIFEDLGVKDVGWFGPPPEKKGDPLHYCFHVDAGIGMNKKSKNFQEALEFVKWTATPEFAQLFMNEVPGFYAYTPGKYELTNPLARAMIDFVGKSTPTVRTVWEKMSAQAPSGNSLMEEALIGMYTDKYTPAQAAAYVQKGLETWYEPFRK